MQQPSDPANTAWQQGPFRGPARGLLFGAMYEDPAIGLDAFRPFSRVFCVASAGCTALALSAAGHEVTAVDMSPKQILYAQARAAGAEMREGAADRLLSRARALFPAIGWTQLRRREFVGMHDTSEQLKCWQRKFDTRRHRAAVDAVLSRPLLGLAYRTPFAGCLPAHFGTAVRARLERTWGHHANRSNPYVSRLLLGEIELMPKPRRQPIRFICADAAAYLEGCRPGSFDAFSLSNITDGAPSSYVQRLSRAVDRTAAAGALVVLRSFAEPQQTSGRNLAARDRSMIWGGVHVSEARELCFIF